MELVQLLRASHGPLPRHGALERSPRPQTEGFRGDLFGVSAAGMGFGPGMAEKMLMKHFRFCHLPSRKRLSPFFLGVSSACSRTQRRPPPAAKWLQRLRSSSV